MISRAVILHDRKILLIHRFNERKEYYVLPGGHVEEGESEEHVLLREVEEETGLDAKINKKLWTLEKPSDKSKHHFFLVTKITGRLKLGCPEAKRNSEHNKYILEWHDLNKITDLRILPESAKEKLIEEFLQ